MTLLDLKKRVPQNIQDRAVPPTAHRPLTGGVVSIGLFWFCFMIFMYNGVYFLWQKFSSRQTVIVNSNTLFLRIYRIIFLRFHQYSTSHRPVFTMVPSIFNRAEDHSGVTTSYCKNREAPKKLVVYLSWPDSSGPPKIRQLVFEIDYERHMLVNHWGKGPL